MGLRETFITKTQSMRKKKDSVDRTAERKRDKITRKTKKVASSLATKDLLLKGADQDGEELVRLVAVALQAALCAAKGVAGCGMEKDPDGTWVLYATTVTGREIKVQVAETELSKQKNS